MWRLLLAWAVWGGVGLAQWCDQPFSPVRAGWEWQYRTQGDNPGSYVLRRTGIANNGFTQTRQTENSKEETKYRCTPEGFFPVEVGGGGVARAAAAGQSVSYDLDVVGVKGVSIPDYDRWEVGSSWSMVMEVRGTGSQGPVRYNISGTLETHYKVVAQESVTTPAGKFSALKLETQFATKMRASAGPVTIPLNFESKGLSWYAENVGLVKQIQGKNTTELVALKK